MKAKRMIPLMLALVLLLTVNVVPASAIAEASDHITSYTCTIAPLGNGRIEINFYVMGTERMAELGVTRIDLKESSDGVNWYDVESYRYEDYEDMPGGNVMMGRNVTFHDNILIYNGTPGMQYKAYVTYYGSDGMTSTTRYRYTLPRTAT